jgi:hypothetical protein
MLYTRELAVVSAFCGLLLTFWAYFRTSNIKLTAGILFFAAGGVLQSVQYWFVAAELRSADVGHCGGSNSVKYYGGPSSCDTYTNKILTLLTFLHFCFQPYFCHKINASLTKRCLFKGMRFFFSYHRICFFFFRSLYDYR